MEIFQFFPILHKCSLYYFLWSYDVYVDSNIFYDRNPNENFKFWVLLSTVGHPIDRVDT